MTHMFLQDQPNLQDLPIFRQVKLYPTKREYSDSSHLQLQVDRIINIPNEQGISETGRERGRNIWIAPTEHFDQKFSRRAIARPL